eukprot:jgi/Tetstr1/425253/TSEL_015707.t2
MASVLTRLAAAEARSPLLARLLSSSPRAAAPSSLPPAPPPDRALSPEEAILSRLCRPPVRGVVAWPARRGSGTVPALRFAEHGAPAEVLTMGQADMPALGPTDVLVDFLAAPINPADINIIEGKYPLKPPLPATPGNEGVAVVYRVGAKACPATSHHVTAPQAHCLVTHFLPEARPAFLPFLLLSVDPECLRPGDRVVPLDSGLGTWRAAAVVPADALYRVPPSIPTLTAATLTVNPPTALCLLERFAELEPGCTIIQNGANSAVGQAVIELAAARKINTVNVIRQRDDWEDVSAHLRGLGATVVTTLEHAVSASGCHLQFLKEHSKLPTCPSRCFALNCVGGASATKLAKMLSHGGTLVTYGGMSLQPVTLPTPLLIFKDIRARGFALSVNCTRAEKAALLDTNRPDGGEGGVRVATVRDLRV